MGSLVVFLGLVQWTCAARVLVLTLPLGKSHIIHSSKLVNELVRRDHVVGVGIVQEELDYFKRLVHTEKPHWIVAEAAPERQERSQFDDYVAGIGHLEGYRAFFDLTVQECQAQLRDQVFLRKMKEFKADVLLYDPTFDCNLILRELAEIQHSVALVPIAVNADFKQYLTGIQSFPGLEKITTYPFPTDRSKHLERVMNLFRGLFWQPYSSLRYPKHFQEMTKQFELQDMKSLMRKTDLLLIGSHEILDEPLLSFPNVKHVGCLLPSEDSRQVEGSIGEFVKQSPAGFILISFGTSIKSQDWEHILIGFISRLLESSSLNVIWKVDAYAQSKMHEIFRDRKSRVFIDSWLPQNQLLATAPVKLLISHGGHNSVCEAAFHGIPVIGTSTVLDRYDSVERARNRGFGKHAFVPGDSFNVSVSIERLFETTMAVLSDPSFRHNALVMSTRMKMLQKTRSPTEQVIDWVEFVLTTQPGKSFMKGPHISLEQVLCLDLMLPVTVMCIVLILSCSFLRRK